MRQTIAKHQLLAARFVLIGRHLAIDFANTVYSRSGGEGTLVTWPDLVDFLEATGAVDRASAARWRGLGRRQPGRAGRVLARTLELRAAIRAMLADIEADRPLPREGVAMLNAVLRSRRSVETLVADGKGWRLAVEMREDDPASALAPIARSMAELIAEGPLPPVRKCGRPACVLYFLDDSRTGMRRWCSMAVCGNRIKVAAHARRALRRRRRR